MKQITNLIIVDASTSMQPKREEVVNGLSTLLTEIKKDAIRDKKEVRTTTIILEFSSPNFSKVILNTEDSTKIDTELGRKYSPNGNTALFDAIGEGFRLIPLSQDGVFVNIFTDGEENASTQYSHQQVKDIITVARDRKWAVTFMGTTEESIKKAEDMGISRGNTFMYENTKKGTLRSFNKMSDSRNTYYSNTVSGQSMNVDKLMED